MWFLACSSMVLIEGHKSWLDPVLGRQVLFFGGVGLGGALSALPMSANVFADRPKGAPHLNLFH